MKQHPFLENTTNVFPSQNLPLSQKKEPWKRACIDAGEWEGRKQLSEKIKLLDNYKLANDEVIEKEYGKDSQNFDLLEQLTKYNGVPDVIKNYGIISQPIATLEGEMDNFPDVFNVKGKGDIFESEKNRVKTDLLRQWFLHSMNTAVDAKMMEMEDEDPDSELFQDEEQYAQAREQQFQIMYPPEIQKYMKTSYRHILEIWGQMELKDQFERFKLKNLRRKDFHHWLRIAQRFRHQYAGPKGLVVESLNPIFTFCKKSPNIDNVQDGDLAGFIQVLTVPAIIDRWGHLMTENELNSLQIPYKDSVAADVQKRPDGSRIDYLHPDGNPYQTRVSPIDKEILKAFPDMMQNTGSLGGMFLGKEELSKIDGVGDDVFGVDMLCATTVYWRSQRKVGKLSWINPESGLEEVLLVDETFDVPKYIKQIKDEKFDSEAGLNTLIWTRETEIWQGVKISNYSGNNIMQEPLYLGVGPADIQIGKLLVAGHFANNINTSPTSLVDKSKSWQWFFNVLINQAYLYIQTEILPFAVYSSDMIPNDKDWGTEDEALIKWLTIGQALGGVVAGSSNSPLPSSDGGQYPRMVDLDRGTRIQSRINLALQIKQLALEHIGISPQRMGAVKASETASGVNQAVTSSGVQTSVWYTSFFEGEKEILQWQLDAAKYLQSRGKQIDTINKSELSLEALNLALEDGDLYDLHVYITDSQQELRDLQVAKQLALENNTSEMMMSDRLKLSTGSSLQEIITGLEESERQMIERRNQDLQLKQQQLEQQGMDAQAAREQAERHIQMEIEKDIQIALITAMGRQKDVDVDDNGIADLLEYNKIINTNNQIENQKVLGKEQLELDKQIHQDNMTLKQRELLEKREQMKAQFKLEDKKLKRDIVRGDKSK